MKDADGFWVGDYWGVSRSGSNANVVARPRRELGRPQEPRVQGHGGPDGDPRSPDRRSPACSQRRLPTAARSTTSSPGIQFFADLKKPATSSPSTRPRRRWRTGRPRSRSTGTTCSAYGDEFKGNIDWKVSVPRTACSALLLPGDQHVCAAPVRGPALAGVPATRTGPAALAEGLHPPRPVPGPVRSAVSPGASGQAAPGQYYGDVKFPTQAQTDAATDGVAESWGPKVLGQLA